MSQPPTQPVPKPMPGKFSGIVVDSSRTTPNFKIPAKRPLPIPGQGANGTGGTNTSATATAENKDSQSRPTSTQFNSPPLKSTVDISPDTSSSGNSTPTNSSGSQSRPISTQFSSPPLKSTSSPIGSQSPDSGSASSTPDSQSRPTSTQLNSSPSLKPTNVTPQSPDLSTNTPTPNPRPTPNITKSTVDVEPKPINKAVAKPQPRPPLKTPAPQTATAPSPSTTVTPISRPPLKTPASQVPSSTPTPSTPSSTPTTPTSSSTPSTNEEVITKPPMKPSGISSSFKSKPLPSTSKASPTTPTLSSTTAPTASSPLPPQRLVNESVTCDIEISDISKECTIKEKQFKKSQKSTRVRVLSNKKGDFTTLNVNRGDIIQIVEKGEKDTYVGSNGLKTASFSISNTKDLYPEGNKPSREIAKAIAIKDIKSNRNFTIIRGDILCVLEKKSDQVSSGRVKVGLDGWGEMGEFPNDSIRLINEEEYLLYSDLLDTIIEVSEKLMDPDSLVQTKESEKELEKRQLALRDKVKQVQLTREKILLNEDPNQLKQLHIELRRDIETIRCILSNEFYIINDAGEILSEENCSPITLLKEYNNYAKVKNNNKDLKSMIKDETATAAAAKQSTWEYGQLLIDIKFNRCTLPKKNFEFYFSLYNSTQSRFITEQVQINYDQSNSLQAPPIPSAFKFLFKNIESNDLSDDVILVCKVVRKGPIKEIENEKDQKKDKNSGVIYRRPYACAIFKFTSSNLFESQIGLERETTLQFFTCINESQFPSIIDILTRANEEEMKKQIEAIPKIPGIPQSALPIAISFYDTPIGKFIEKYPISQTWIKSEKLSHKTVIAEKVHQFYLTLDTGKFTQGKKLELSVRVRLENGEFLNNCIALGTGHNNFASEIKSLVFYNNTSPIWNENIQFNISKEQFTKAHLLFTIKNCSSKSKESGIFAFTWLKLGSPDQTVVGNSDHTLVLFKSGNSDQAVNSYIDLNPVQSTQHPINSPNLRKGEILKIKTYLNSSEFIQHQSINQLLNWKQENNLTEKDLHSILDKFKFVDPIQIMRHLTKILDSLFRIYDSKNNQVSGGFEVYNTITFIIGLLTDERTNRFKNFKQELDQYINNQFSVSSAHKHILKCISLSLQEQKENSKTFSSTLKSLEYVFRLIVKSRLVYLEEKQQLQKEEEARGWKKELLEFLSLINKLMSNNSPTLIVTQTLAMRNFSIIMTGLQNFFSKQEQCKILNEFIEAVHYTEKQEQLNSHKLSVYHKILSTNLLLDVETIPHLVPTLVSTIDQHLTRGLELKLSTQLLSLLLESLPVIIQSRSNSVFDNIMKLFSKVLTLQDNILSSITADLVKPTQDSSSSIFNMDSIFLISNFLTMLYYSANIVTSEKNPSVSYLEQYIEDLQSEHLIKLFLRKMFRILDGFLSKNVYSNNWPSLQLFQHRTTLDIIIKISPLFFKYVNIPTLNLPTTPSNIGSINNSSLSISGGKIDSSMDIESWTTIFNLNFAILNSNFMRNPSNRINRLKYLKPQIKSIINQSLNSIKLSWEQLKLNQNIFIQYLIPNLLYSLLNGNKLINEFIQDLFLVIIKKEFLEIKSLKKIESRCIEILDKIIIRERISDEEIFKSFFRNRLLVSLISSKESVKEQDSNQFINNIIHLLSLLFDFRTLPTDRAFEEERTIATLKMMEYFKDRKDTYIKYLYELLNQHISNNYNTEAGFTILLHSDLYEWSDTLMCPLYNVILGGQPVTMPQESNTERKIRLIRLAIQYLDKGQVWEKCIGLIHELKSQFEDKYNFKALSELVTQEAEFYEKILNTERLFCEYFRVGYYGKKFPVTIQGKEFLYRGFELERLPDFSQRILAKFPNAELLKSTSEPTLEIQNSDAQYLLITIVNASSKEEIQKKQKPFIEGTPNNSKNYMKRNDVNLFVYSKPFEKESEESNPLLKDDKNNKFGTLWIKNHFLFTDSSFPTIHRRSEVIKKQQVDLSPLENAINSVAQKNDELDEMVKKYEKDSRLNLNPLAMALNGSIDAAVNGGVSLYKDAFFTNINPKTPSDNRIKLINVLKKQVDILGKGLQIHSQRCPEELKGLHEKLENFFPKFKSQVFSLTI